MHHKKQYNNKKDTKDQEATPTSHLGTGFVVTVVAVVVLFCLRRLCLRLGRTSATLALLALHWRRFRSFTMVVVGCGSCGVGRRRCGDRVGDGGCVAGVDCDERVDVD